MWGWGKCRQGKNMTWQWYQRWAVMPLNWIGIETFTMSTRPLQGYTTTSAAYFGFCALSRWKRKRRKAFFKKKELSYCFLLKWGFNRVRKRKCTVCRGARGRDKGRGKAEHFMECELECTCKVCNQTCRPSLSVSLIKGCVDVGTSHGNSKV